MTAHPPPAVVCRRCGCPRLIATHIRKTLRGTVRHRRCPDCGTIYRALEIIEATVGTLRPVADRLDRAADVAVGFLRHTDEDGVALGDLYERVRRRVPGVTSGGFAFRLGRDSRVTRGDDDLFRVISPTA